MSDDEYYGEYDDFDESLWDADPAPDLADDLAEHAAYSPVWQDDPVGELDAYHSDWEYYSDDYYDDDPILKLKTLDGSSDGAKASIKRDDPKRGKKRKLDEAREPITHGKGSLAESIRGTVWARKDQERTTVYHQGQEQKVALLKNWRELFTTDTGESHTFGKGQLQRDESWANDLSLAEMGLLPEQGKTGTRKEAVVEDEAEDIIDLEDCSEEDEADRDMEAVMQTAVNSTDLQDMIVDVPVFQSSDATQAGVEYTGEPGRKRHKTSRTSSSLHPRDTSVVSHQKSLTNPVTQVLNSSIVSERSEGGQILSSVQGEEIASMGIPQSGSTGGTRGRKRRISSEAKETSETEPSTGKRNKRVATQITRQDKLPEVKAQPETTQRVTRSRKR